MRFKALTLSIILSVASVSVANAQTPTDADTAEARARFTEGVKAFEAKKYEQARVAFTQAYALKPLPDILRNLGTVEIRSGHLRDGARHLAEFLRSGPVLSVVERRDIEKELTKAQSKLGRILIVGGSAETQLSVDGEPVGAWVSAEPLYVEPGEHAVLATRAGYADQRHTAKAAAGEQVAVSVELQPLKSEPAPVTPLPPLQDPPERDAGATMPQAQSEQSIVPIIVGGSVAALGLAGGIGFRLAASSKQDHADRLAHANNSECYQSQGGDCAELKDANKAVDRNRNLSTASFALAATGGVLTLGYYLFWPKDSATSRGVRPTAVASPHGASLWLNGNF
jgi:hypothetical protein